MMRQGTDAAFADNWAQFLYVTNVMQCASTNLVIQKVGAKTAYTNVCVGTYEVTDPANEELPK